MTRFPLRYAPLFAAALAVALIGRGAPPAAGQEPESAVLKAEVEVHDDLVTLGDLFDNAGAAADAAVFRAPDLGTRGTVAVRRVARAAERHGLEWSNPAGVDQISVRRPSRMIGLDEVATLIGARLAAELGVDDAEAVEIELDRGAKPIHIDPRVGAPLVVKRLDHDMRSGAFRALVGPEDGHHDVPDRAYHGRGHETVTVAVPARAIQRGARIAASDIDLERVAKRSLPADAAVDRDALVGMAAKRPLTAGRVIRRSDLERARIVRRNAHVSIVYEAPGLLLRTTGRALDDGAEGDGVAVLNLQSKRTVHAEVSGPGEVKVSTGLPESVARRKSRRSASSGGGRMVR